MVDIHAHHQFGNAGKITGTAALELDRPNDFAIQFHRYLLAAGSLRLVFVLAHFF
jgi:hypothetical protein